MSSGCSVSLEATQATIAAGAPVGLSGTLTCGEGASAGGQTVTLYRKVAGEPGFGVAATATTSESGAFQFALDEVEVKNVLYVTCDGAKSPRVTVRVVAFQVNIETPTAGTALLVGPSKLAGSSALEGAAVTSAAVTFTGTVSPTDAGATVTLQREFATGRWHRIAVGAVDDEGKYSIVHTFSRPGEANLRAVVHSHGAYTASVSAPVTYPINRVRSAAH